MANILILVIFQQIVGGGQLDFVMLHIFLRLVSFFPIEKISVGKLKRLRKTPVPLRKPGRVTPKFLFKSGVRARPSTRLGC